MSIVVIGAGVVGLSTAYALRADGHDVTVVERADGPGLGTSYANAGGLCPSFAGPWAAPGMTRKALRWLFSSSAPLKIRPRPNPQQWLWLARFAQECDASRSAKNKRAMQAIAHYSYACLNEIADETGLAFDKSQGGVLQTFRSTDTLAAGRRASDVLADMGISHALVGPDEIAQIEPALARCSLEFTGALHLPEDGTGDAQAYCRGMASWLEARGTTFRYSTEVTGLPTDRGRLTGIDTRNGRIDAEAAVLSAGPWVKSLAPEVPIYPVKGYSLTYDAFPRGAGPRSSIMDEDSKVMLTRLADRLRVAGVAELDGFAPNLRTQPVRSMERLATAFFPGAAGRKPLKWAGFRPMTPDGRPRIGPSRRIEGLWINAGHGSNGWTQAAGAGRLIADLIAGKAPEIDPAPYALAC